VHREPPAYVSPARGRTLPALVAARVLDAELGGLAWTVLERRVPLLVAGPVAAESGGAAADPAVELASAFIPFLDPASGRAVLRPAGVEGDPTRDVLVAGLLEGGDLRRAVRAAGRGFGLVAAVRGASLAEVLDRLRALPVGATDEAVGRLGLVLVTGGAPARVEAAHYLRPVVRDAGGHLRRPGPAVVATWDDVGERFDHFGWGIYPELAARIGVRAGDLEREHGERAAWLEHGVAARHGFDGEDLARALAMRRRAGGPVAHP
jgi:hypothetical protein